MFFRNKKKFLSVLLAIESIFSIESLNLSQAQKNDEPKTQITVERKKSTKPVTDINFLKNHKNKIIGGTVFAALALVFFSTFSSKQNQNKGTEAKEQIATTAPILDNSKTQESPNLSVNKNDVKIHETNTEIQFNGGLPNPGATCYMNSVLQMLFRVPGFRDRVINYNGADPVCCSLKEIFIKLYQNKRVERDDVLIFFDEMRKHVSWFPHDGKGQREKKNIQCDAFEFFSSLIDNIKIDEIFSPFTMEIFTDVKFPCNPEVSFEGPTEENLSLSLDISHATKFSECIEQHFQSRIINDEYELQDGRKVCASTQFYINPSEYIVLQMNRFSFDFVQWKNTKIDKQIRVDEKEIDFSNYMYGKSEGNNKYKIVGAINHIGSAEFGHYVYTHLINDNEALLCNDFSVKKINIQTAWENIERSYIILLKRT